MRMKLAALLVLLLLLLAGAGCSTTDTANTANTNKANNSSAANTNNTAAPEVAKANDGTVKASSEPTETTGGTKEGCKCSAAGMACSTKDGKGCCGKDGCSTMKDGKSSCCASAGKEGAACCSTAGKTASNKGMGDMPMGNEADKKPAATKKS